MADSDRWRRFALRPGDVVISTPSKSGTTWMQNIVGMLLLRRVDLGAPISRISPWLDMMTRSEAEVFALLEAQQHRRFIKTHTPLDGLPARPDLTYITVFRHPLDVALSNLDHAGNMVEGRPQELLAVAGGEPDPQLLATYQPPPSDEPGEFLRWWIDCDRGPTGSGPNSLLDYCQQASIAWARRHRPEVHLFHYSDLWADLDGEMRRVAAALGVDADGFGDRAWAELVDGARLDAMRARAKLTAPEADQGMWRSDARFFARGGRREWPGLLSATDLEHFRGRLVELTGDAADWIERGARSGRT